MKPEEIIPVKNYLLVELEPKDEEDKKTEGGIIVSNKRNNLHLRKGKVLAVPNNEECLIYENKTIVVSENCMLVRVDEINTRLVLIPSTEILMIIKEPNDK